MKQFKKLLCLLLALLFAVSTLASCGGDETDGGDGTTVAPCETHTLPAGLCTDAKTCTVCGTVVEGTAHTYAEGSLCTEARSCTVCNAAAPVNASHTAGPAATCGTDQLCVNCDYMFAERTYRHGYKDGFCEVCGQPKPWEIETLTINGQDIGAYTIVIPNQTNYEAYIAALLQHRVEAWHGVKLEIKREKEEKTGPEIRIGKTNRTVTEVGDFEYTMQVIDGDLEIVCGNMLAFDGLVTKICNVIKRNNAIIEFTEETAYNQTFSVGANDEVKGDVRVMFHNVLQFGENINIATRVCMFRMLYDYYKPDVIGMQEANGTFFNDANGIALTTYLGSAGYSSLGFGNAEVIYYNTKTLKMIATEYIKTAGNYGTNWVLFQHIETGEYFGVECSHFAADSVATAEMSGNEMRKRDARSTLTAKEKLIEAAKANNVPDAENLPIIIGGDYNSRVGDDPVDIVEEVFTNVRNLITDPSMVDDYATHQGGPEYNRTYKYHPPHYYTGGKGTGKNSIDHAYAFAHGINYTINQYRVITNQIAAGASDHMPHFVDFSFK